MPTSADDSKGPLAAVALGTHANGGGFNKFRRIGIASWSAIGIIALTVLVAGGISALSGILIPLVIAAILGTVLEPVVTWLVRHRMPRALAAVLVLLAATSVAVGIAAIVVYGFVQQIPEISLRLLSGWAHVLDWLRSLNINPSWVEQLRLTASDSLSQAGHGAVGAVTGAVYGTVMLSIGAFFAIYFLFFVLRDGRLFPAWLARVTSQEEALVDEIDVQVRESMRGYFSGTAVTALITGPIFVIPLILLGIPLVLPMIVLYFFLSFVPYIGAWITGAFAVLISFGFGGAPAALIVALSLLISNGVLQSAVNSWALGSSLKIHPVMVLLSTIIGGVVAGILGMVLGPPVMSALQKVIVTVRAYRARNLGN